MMLRAITGLVGAIIIVGSTVYSPWSFAVVFLAILLLTLKEFYMLAGKAGFRLFELWGIMFSSIGFVLLLLNYQGIFNPSIFWVLPAFFFVLFICPLMASDRSHVMNCLAVSVLGICYVALPFSLLIPIAFRSGEFQFELVTGILFVQWANDSGAYFAGKIFGKRKFFEKVSPNKTREGAIGGFLFAIVCAQAFCYYFGVLSYSEWAGLAVIIGIFGNVGDLIESLFKRILAVKDSGNAIPGHGGFLDRFDSLLLSIPFSLAYLTIIG